MDHGEIGGPSPIDRIWSSAKTSIAEAFPEIGDFLAQTQNITIPIFIPRNVSNIPEAGLILDYTILPNKIRALGRGLGDSSIGVTFGLGLMINLLPSTLDNISSNATIGNWIADYQIDTFGYLLSELVGYGAVGIFVPEETATGAAAPGTVLITKVTADIAFGVLYDYTIDKIGFREFLGQGYDNLLIPSQPNLVPLPVPTPPPYSVPNSTPHP